MARAVFGLQCVEHLVRSQNPGATRGQCKKREAALLAQRRVQKLSDIDLVDLPRFSSGFAELDRVLVVASSRIGNTHRRSSGGGEEHIVTPDLCALAARAPALYVTGGIATASCDAREAPGT